MIIYCRFKHYYPKDAYLNDDRGGRGERKNTRGDYRIKGFQSMMMMNMIRMLMIINDDDSSPSSPTCHFFYYWN